MYFLLWGTLEMKMKINYFQRNGKLLSVQFPTETAFGQILALARAFVQHDVSCKENTDRGVSEA